MNESSQNASPETDWDTYWQGSQQAVAFAAEGVNHPLVHEFWRSFFATESPEFESPRIIDIACGKGAVIEAAHATFGEAGARYECLDTSEHAIAAVKKQFPGVVGHVADARNIALGEGAYDIVASQFGIEYAGIEAVTGAARLVGPGGRLVLMMHHREGSIYRECANNLAASKALEDSQLIELAVEMFAAGYAVLRGEGSKDAYNDATRAVIPAMHAMESVAENYGSGVTGGTIVQLYSEIANIQEDIQHYDDKEISDWLTSMRDEMSAYAGRMRSMCSAAVDEASFRGLVDSLQAGGFEVLQSQALSDAGRPLAWILVATRRDR